MDQHDQQTKHNRHINTKRVIQCQSRCKLPYQSPNILVDYWLYQSFTAHQHQKGHTVPKQVSPLDDDDITGSTRKKRCGSTVWELHCLRTALCESIHYQAKSEQNLWQDLIPRARHREAALCTPQWVMEEIEYYLGGHIGTFCLINGTWAQSIQETSKIYRNNINTNIV